MSKRVFDLEKKSKFLKENLLKKSVQHNFSKIYWGNKHDKGDQTATFCSDWMSGSHFMQANFC